MKRFKFFFALVMLFAQQVAFGQSNGFQIIYLADLKYATDAVWLDKIKADWSATGINLRIKWNEVEKASFASTDDDWSQVDQALQLLNSKSLDIYVRVSFIFTDDAWYSQFNTNDFHIGSDGNFYLNPNNGGRRELNFIASTPRTKMKDFFQRAVQRLNSSLYASRIKLIVPTFSQDDETEWPSLRQGYSEPHMAGYSTNEQSAFRSFLSTKYAGNITSLNTTWGSSYGSFSNIYIDDNSNNPDLNWHRQPLLNQPQYRFPRGRKDWIDFRAQELKKFIEELQSITKSNSNFKFGIQLGSLYDHLLTFRTSYDPTSLLEKIDYLTTGDVPEFDVNFFLSADYSRSVCKYWDWKNSRNFSDRIKFATETNWPGYINLAADTLNKYWERQVNAFYGRGASALFVSHWGTTDTGDALGIPVSVKNGTLPSVYYSKWKPTLAGRFKNATLLNISHPRAAHLSGEQSLYFRTDTSFGGYYFYNNGVALPGMLGIRIINQQPDTIRRYEYPFYRFFRPRGVYSQYNSQYGGWSDIVTNYMLSSSPAYITSNYTELYLTATSFIMPTSAYLTLMRKDLKDILMSNATYFLDGTHGEFAFTPAIRTAYNDYRSPIHLIWRTRPDLQSIWPSASLPASGSGWVIDFVKWAYDNGTGQDNPYPQGHPLSSPIREYPAWMIKDANGKHAYDENIRWVWNQDTNLQNIYTDAHNRTQSSSDPVNMIEWAKLNPSRPQDQGKLKNYNYWPFIGSGLYVTISGPGALASKQTGTWTANVTGTSGTVTYKWYVSTDGGWTWSTLGTSPTQSYTMGVNCSAFKIRCDVLDVPNNVITKPIKDIQCSTAKLTREKEKGIPITFALHENYPNPFNPSTQIRFDLPETGQVSLVVFDVLGQKVIELEKGYFDAGYHATIWNGKNSKGQSVASGVYFIQLRFTDSAGQLKFIKANRVLLAK